MRQLISGVARPVGTGAMPWIPTGLASRSARWASPRTAGLS
jgi:hypothetical protein